jgi:flagellar hook assembly protein FlgD
LRTLALTLVAAMVAALGVFLPATTPGAAAATNPKVAIIVGATHGVTSTYRTYADQVYAEAIKYTSNVVKVYSPNATWSRVRAAVNGASIVVYMGHGNGWPSPYTYDPNFTTKDGFGLNYDLNGDGKLSDYENKYYGEPKIATLTPAPNAVVLLFHLCYASGNSEPGNADPSLSVARQRVDNYASAFLRAGAGAVIANGHSHDPYYIRALFTTRESIDQYWRNAPDFNDDVRAYASTRTSGATLQLDPQSAGKYYRSVAGDMSLMTQDVTGAAYASTSGDPGSFVVPGNASPAADGAPIYGSATDAVSGSDPVATAGTGDKVRIQATDSDTAAEATGVFQVHVDGVGDGWMLASDLVPRDSAPPRVWSTSDGTGSFSPNGDGTQDTMPLTLRLSESADWSVKIVNRNDTTKASKSGTGDRASLTWAPDPGTVSDGAFTWQLTATDAWGNTLHTSGQLTVDTQAPDVTVSGSADAVVSFTPNGDGSADAVTFQVGSNEPGRVTATVAPDGGKAIDTQSVVLSGSSVPVAWDGRKSDGSYAPDGRYDISFVAVDAAGNSSKATARTVDAYGALRDTRSTRLAFYPQDGDRLAKTTGFSFRLLSPATVTWTVVNGKGVVVRTIAEDAAMDAGLHSVRWNGRADDGSYVRTGNYWTVVQATNGTQTAVQRAKVLAAAFRISVSDSTPRRGQRIRVTVISAEPLSTRPRLAISQPGRTTWRVTMTKVSKYKYRVTIRLKPSGTGKLRLRVYARDTLGNKQATTRNLRLH